jgi:hypothetical protein
MYPLAIMLMRVNIKQGSVHSDIFYHEEHEVSEDKEKSFVFLVINKIA